MIRGWCPSLHEPMATGDGLLVRVKPPLGYVSAEAAGKLAAAAAYGNGAIELTGRGALQFRGLTADSAARFAAVAVALGLAVADPARERRRTVLMSPLAGLDPAVAANTIDLAGALEAAVLCDDGLAALPAKFRFAVDGGGALELQAGADISLMVGDEDCLVVPAGADRGLVVGFDDAVPAVIRMAQAFLALAGGERRMRALPAAQVLALSSVAGSTRGIAGSSPASSGAGVGPLPGGVFGVGVPFGSLDAATLAALGGIRLTPWRVIVVAGSVDPADLAALGLIGSPDDPRLLVSACPGQPGCASASVETRNIAATLRPSGTVHVSGCSKGCAHPGPAGLTFVGRDGRFDLIRNGRAGDVPVRRGIEADAVGHTQ